MKDEPGRIITSLKHRLSVEAAMRDMLEATSPEEFQAMAARIARQGAHQVTPVILANLGTTDPRFRTVLGTVAQHLDREEIAYALREAVMEPGRSDQERATALLILSRFLGEEVSESLYLELSDPLEVARQSLRELAAEAERGSEAYEVYLRSLEDEPLDVLLLILRATQDLDAPLIVEPLRLLAQDPHETVSEEAIRLLGTLRVPEAVVALRSLIPCLAPDRRRAAERALRKLALAGVSAPPPLPLEEHCRLLVSPLGGQGTRSIWVLERTSEENRLNLFAVMLMDGYGIVDSFGAEGLSEAPIHWSPDLGAVHRLILRERGYRIDLLEADPGYAVRLLEEGTQQALERVGSLPPEYRVWNKVLWKYKVPPPTPPLLPTVSEAQRGPLRQKVKRLLGHPTFDSWVPWTSDLEEWVAAWERTSPPDLTTSQGTTLARRLIAEYYQEEALETCRRWLLGNSEWFLMAGERELAELALVAAEDLDLETRTEHPFLLALAERALLLAWDALHREKPAPEPKRTTRAPRPH